MDTLRDILVISVALDMKHSSDYTNREKKLSDAINALENNEKYNIVKLELELADKSLIEHIKRETKDVQYHRDPHPNESAGISKEIVIRSKQGEVLSTFEERARSASAFAIHDAEYGEHVDGLNEINSAALHYQAKIDAYDKLLGDISQDDTLDQAKKENAIQAIEEYKKSLAYEAWKSIVAGTTMLKRIDGQPTVFVAQKLAVEEILQTPMVHGNALDRQTMVMSMVDSNFAAFIKQLQNDPKFKNHLPSSLLRSIPEHVQAILFNPKDEPLNKLSANVDKTTIDTAGLLYGQNERMFPEIHALYKAALYQSKFDIIENEKIVTKNGVVLWNEAMEAARVGDNDKLARLLEAGSTEVINIPPFPANAEPPPSIPEGSTLQDIFIHRIGSEINFAKQQGTELYKNLADKLGFEHPDIDYDAWNKHAVRLANLRDRYNDPKTNKLEVSKALFHIASHQPGVFLDCDKCLGNIDKALKEMDNLTKRKNELDDRLKELKINIQGLEEKIQKEKEVKSTVNTDEAQASKASTSSVSMALLLTEDAGGPQQTQLNTYKKEMAEILKEQGLVIEKLGNVEDPMKLKSNLERTKNELSVIQKDLHPKEVVEEKSNRPT